MVYGSFVYNEPMRFLAIDYGKKRVGIAISDEAGKFALPKVVLDNDKSLIENIQKICAGSGIGKIVLGESNDLSGRPNPIMEDISRFKRELEAATTLPVHLEPEFFTSAEAEQIQGKNKMHDASAAALILKHYLEKRPKV